MKKWYGIFDDLGIAILGLIVAYITYYFHCPDKSIPFLRSEYSNVIFAPLLAVSAIRFRLRILSNKPDEALKLDLFGKILLGFLILVYLFMIYAFIFYKGAV